MLIQQVKLRNTEPNCQINYQELDTICLVSCLIALGQTYESEHEEKDVDYIEIESQGGEDVLFGGDRVLVVPSHHHLGVVHQVHGEQKGSYSSIYDLQILVVGNKDHDDAKDHQPEKDADEDSAHHGEVPLGLNIF